MRALVTGGSGFIGSHVVDRLLAEGHEARVFDVRAGTEPRRKHCEYVIGDLLEPDDINAAARGCDVIIHLAAAADVGLVAKDPAGSEALNSRGTLNVLEAARATGARVVYASTIWVYSDVRATEVDEDSELGLPSHLYTATKLAGEMYCRSYGELYDVPSTILRFGIPYGPRARPAAVLPIFVNKALAGDPITIAGDGLQSAPLRLRRGPRRGRRARAAPRGRGPRLQPRRRGGDDRPRHRRGREERRRRRADRPHPGPRGGLRRRDGVRRARRRRARLAPAHVVRRRRAALRRLAHRGRRRAGRGRRGRAGAGRRARARTAAAPPRLARIRGSRPVRAIAPHAQSAVSGILALIVYGYLMTSIGLLADEMHTVIVVAVLAVVATLSTRSTQAKVAVWLTAAVGAALLIPPQPTGVLDMQQLNLPLLALALTGAGFVLLATASGRRRVLELAEQGER